MSTAPESTSPSLHEACAAVRAFVAAADARDAQALEALLHPDFRVVFASAGAASGSLLPRGTYLTLLEQGKVGGVPRSFELLGAEGALGVSTVRAALDGPTGQFSSVYTVIQTGGVAQIIQDATVFQPA